MLNLLKSIWEIFIELARATKPFWWSNFWWTNAIKIVVTLICLVMGISKKKTGKAIGVALAVYSFLSILSLLIQ